MFITYRARRETPMTTARSRRRISQLRALLARWSRRHTPPSAAIPVRRPGAGSPGYSGRLRGEKGEGRG